jgi:hypothetical protein
MCDRPRNGTKECAVARSETLSTVPLLNMSMPVCAETREPSGLVQPEDSCLRPTACPLLLLTFRAVASSHDCEPLDDTRQPSAWPVTETSGAMLGAL